MTSNVSAWEFISEDKKEVLIEAVVYRSVPNYKPEVVRLRGLDPKKKYRCGYEEYTGSSLMAAGLPLKKGKPVIKDGIELPFRKDDNNSFVISLSECR